MAVTFSDESMRAMGFRPFEVGESISASFVSITVYEARGIALQSSAPEITAGAVGDANYCVAVGTKLNETCRALAGDTYVEDEGAWSKEMETSGPFLIVQLGPTQMYTITEGQIKTEKDGSATTADSFSELRTDLVSLEALVLPPLLTSLSCQLAEPDHYLELRKLDRTSAGRTANGQVIRDIRFTVRARGYACRAIQPDAVSDGLKNAAALARRLNTKAARFFALSMAEEDDLKKFLYCFLALEVQTHADFKRIDHARALRKLLNPASPPIPAAVALLQRHADQFRNLFDRFVWCAACVWTGITDVEVQQFKELKAIRDAIAHGTIASPPGEFAQLAQQLARTVLRN